MNRIVMNRIESLDSLFVSSFSNATTTTTPTTKYKNNLQSGKRTFGFGNSVLLNQDL
jgi:hypothetical protein